MFCNLIIPAVSLSQGLMNVNILNIEYFCVSLWAGLSDICNVKNCLMFLMPFLFLSFMFTEKSTGPC